MVGTAVAGVILTIAIQAVSTGQELTGQFLFSGQAVPGATVVATRGGREIIATSDEAGRFLFTTLDDGAWTLRVEMLGFVTESREITVPFAGPPITWALRMRPYEEIIGQAAAAPPSVVAAASTAAAAGEEPIDFADVINGSVNNGAATPFAQPRAFGNNRPSSGALYTGAVTASLGNSAWNARPFSFTDSAMPPPSYGDVQLGFVLSGPLRIPRLLRSGPQSYLSYQRGVTHSATTQSAVVPTAAERSGNFSGSTQTVNDPLTGLPFTGNVVPSPRISPQALALMAYYPHASASASTPVNYQRALLSEITQDQLQLGTTIPVSNRTTLTAALAFQRTVADSANLFDFTDTSRESALDAAVTWARRFNPRLSLRLRYQFTRAARNLSPFFANRTNVSGDAGIAGTSQDPLHWGPPTLLFPDVADLRDGSYRDSVGHTHAAGAEISHRRGRHYLTFGGDLRRSTLDVSSSADPRGTLAFTGAASGHAFADFLLGLPTTSAIALAHAPAQLRGPTYDAYVVDDFRMRGGLTLNLGVRWEYEAPLTEASGRLVNLDVAPDFRAVRPVLAGEPRGSLTGRLVPNLARSSRQEGSAATPWSVMAAHPCVVARRSRQLRRLSQSRSLLAPRAPARAAAAVFARHQRSHQSLDAAHAGRPVSCLIAEHQHVRGRSGFSRRFCAHMAGVRPTRSPLVVDGDHGLSRNARESTAAGFASEHRSAGGGQSSA